MAQDTTVGLLLAAGFGKRFDATGARNKLTQLLENGTPVAEQSAQNLRRELVNVIAVVQSQELADRLTALGCQCLLFEHADQGMGATLAYGAAYILAHFPAAQSVLVALADMPFVRADTIRHLVSELDQGAQTVRPVYQDQAGHPVGFARCHVQALTELTGDSGARQVLQRFQVAKILVQDAGCVRDIDYPADLNARR